MTALMRASIPPLSQQSAKQRLHVDDGSHEAEPGAGGRPGALVFSDEQGRKTFFEPYYKQIQPRVGAAYAVSPRLALSGGYSITTSGVVQTQENVTANRAIEVIEPARPH